MFDAALAAIVRAAVDPLASELRAVRQELALLRSTLPPALVDVATASERLGVSPATVRRRVADGSLASVRVGRSVRIDLGRVRAFDGDDVAAAAAQAVLR